MSKWAYALVAAVVVVIGCGGSGGNGGGGNNGGNGGNTDSTAFVTISGNTGLFQNVYLTGQGRAAGDLVAIIRRVAMDDSNGTTQTVLIGTRRLQLNGYTHQTIPMDIPSGNSRLFDHYNLTVEELDVENTDGSLTQVSPQQSQPFVQASFDSYFRIFPGRTTSLTVRLDDSMFVQNAGPWTFDPDQFQTANFSVTGTDPARMNGFLSDYVMFDISGMSLADQPPFPDASGNATAFFINGDNFALGTLPPGPPDHATADPVPFFVLTPIGYVPGSGVGPRTGIDPNTGQSALFPGTFSLFQLDPRDPLNPASHITALVGTYFNYTKTLNSLGANPQGFEIIAFPSTHDDGVDDCVLFNINSGVISNLYFGQINLSGGPAARGFRGHAKKTTAVKGRGGVVLGTISAFPISQVTDPSNVNNEITGTVTSVDSSDVTLIHSGHYTLDSNNLPGSFSTSGRFIVYRK